MISGSDAVATARNGTHHDVRLPNSRADSLQQRLYQDGVPLSYQQPGGFAGFVGWVLPGLLPGSLLVLLGAAVATAVSWLAWGRRRPPPSPA